MVACRRFADGTYEVVDVAQGENENRDIYVMSEDKPRTFSPGRTRGVMYVDKVRTDPLGLFRAVFGQGPVVIPAFEVRRMSWEDFHNQRLNPSPENCIGDAEFKEIEKRQERLLPGGDDGTS